MADTALTAEGTIPLGRSGGMLPKKILKLRGSEK